MKTTKFIVTQRSITQKFETQVRQAGLVSGLLRPVPEGQALYGQLQAAERTLRQQKEQWNDRAAGVTTARDALASQAAVLKSVSEAVVSLIEAGRRSEVRSLLTSDVGDLAAISGQLGELVKHVPHCGAGLSKWVAELRTAWLDAEQALAAAFSAFDAATHAVSAVLVQVSFLVAQGGALLQVSGVSLPKKPRRKRVTPAVVPAPTPAMVPVPAPAVVSPASALELVRVA
jgi:hypothetical protein